MKVGLILYAAERSSPPSFTSYTLELARSIRALGKNVEVILLTTSKKAAVDLASEFRTYALPGCRLMPGFMTLGNIAVALACARLKLDIIHDPNGVAPFLLQPVSCKSIVTIHDMVSFIYPDTHKSLTNILQKIWLPMIRKVATRIITVSEHSKCDMIQYLSIEKDNISIVPCGVNARYSEITEPGEVEHIATRYGINRPFILYLGDLQARKNVARLIRAFAAIRQDFPDHMLVLAGSATWKYQAIFDTVKQLQLVDHVVLPGYVADIDVPRLYRQASLFVFPSLYEGFGRPPLEAMACGTPVITSSSSSLPEVVGDAAITVDPYDVAALADAISRVLGDNVLRADLRRRGLARAALFSWEQVARQTVAVYEQVLAPAGHKHIPTRHPLKEEHLP